MHPRPQPWLKVFGYTEKGLVGSGPVCRTLFNQTACAKCNRHFGSSPLHTFYQFPAQAAAGMYFRPLLLGGMEAFERGL